MRLILVICASLLLSTLVYSQTPDNAEQVVKRMFDTGLTDGHDQKTIGRLGDAGAVLVTKILAGRDLTPNTIDTALVVIGGSFADPSFVEATSDREPKTALLVLRYLELSTRDNVVKKRIADTGKYVQDNYAASLRAKKQ